MFVRRLKIFLLLVAVSMGLLIARLVWLQLVCGADYLSESLSSLERPAEWLETARGTIYDSRGRPMAVDQLSFDVSLHYDLVRLYDERFWRYQGLKFSRYTGSSDSPSSSAQRYLRREFSIDRGEARRIIDRLTDSESLTFDSLRSSVLAKSDALLAELADICGVPVSEILASAGRINDDVHVVRADVARRRLHRQREEVPVAVSGAAMIETLLADLVPDENERIKLIGQTRIYEMTQCHAALKGVSEDVALNVEDRFVGSFFASGRADRPVVVRTGKGRVYPYFESACHLVGQVGPVPNMYVEPVRPDGPPDDRELRAYRLGDRRGDWGVESLFEDYLRGDRGWQKFDIEGELVNRIEPVHGGDIHLTIDLALHRAIEQLFAEASFVPQEFAEALPLRGGVVVIDVPTGNILAMVSYPDFDLNSYYQYDNWHRINDPKNSAAYWCNRCLSRNYRVGSTVKPSLLLGALQGGVVNSETLINCPGRSDLVTDRPQCWNVYGCGAIDLRRAIRQSCNNYFIEIAERMGIDRTVGWLISCGFGRRLLGDDSGLDWHGAFGETAGSLCPLGRTRPSIGQLRYMSIGRGAFDSSILQLASSMATIARDGVFLAPSLITQPALTGRSAGRLASVQSVRLVKDGMRDVIYEPGGTGYRAFGDFDAESGRVPSGPDWPESTLRIYGKTGSTESSIFACFAASSDGRSIALAVVLEFEAKGGELAGPLARQILLACGELGYLPAPR